jgi:hypothetical protein
LPGVANSPGTVTKEHQRLVDTRDGKADWRRWGPYLSERAWGTVREDYSVDGEAWSFLTHDMARSKAYRWGEDGLGGFCDRYQLLCFAVALWNGRDPILKERAFGLTPLEGNHGEDVKEEYFYLDSTPTHSYARYLYKYPQTEFPYRRLMEENRRRRGQGEEYELRDTGIFDRNRYFDLFVEYAKADPEDLCIRIVAYNRGPDAQVLHLLPQLWFRNTWAWGEAPGPRPIIRREPDSNRSLTLLADDGPAAPLEGLPFEYRLGPRRLYGPDDGEVLFTDNETNRQRLYGVAPVEGGESGYVKDAFHRHIVHGEDCLSPTQQGTKAALHYRRTVPGGGSTEVLLRLTPRQMQAPLATVEETIAARRAEADAFYATVHPPKASAEECRVQRQAFAGLMWTKQNYIFDVDRWLQGDDSRYPPPASRWAIRNRHWRHLNSMRVLSVPDAWEYPWFAAWDLAFHAVPIALIDPDFAKEQLWLMLFEQFQHPNGQIPAYEWEFSDLNPPVHAWAVWRVYNMDRIRAGRADRDFLERCFHKLLINFAWWVNKVDSQGNNVFEGGFLGLDNITVFDRSKRFAPGARLEQSDATGWMGMFCLNLMRIALELAKENPVYEGLATKFFQHYVYIGAAMKHMGGRQGRNLWDDGDGFFYDLLRYSDADLQPLRVRSLVGLVPLYAVERLERRWIEPFAEFRGNLDWFLKHRGESVRHCVNRVSRDGHITEVLTVVDPEQLTRVLERVWDEDEFRSKFGLRSLSRFHERHPFCLGEAAVRYEPGEAESKIKGGNSNWRGPVWFPTTFLMIESLRKLDTAYGDRLRIPSRDGDSTTPGEMARYFADALIGLFIRDENGRRPCDGDDPRSRDPHWRDHILFHEYFHADTGRGLGASHQTGWTALVASLIDEWRR